MGSTTRRARLFTVLVCLLGTTLLACSVWRPDEDVPVDGWWEDRGPVVPHDSFPGDCFLCHTDQGWTELRADFRFDHEKETGVALVGPHARAQCLRCHNDRGPVAVFAQRGCGGCHEDVHRRQLGSDCSACHQEQSGDWRPREEIALHDRTRFPLVGAHAAVACFRCHVGSEVGNFTSVDVECVACHQADLARAKDPDHVAQGWVADCDRCHVPTAWRGAAFNHGSFYPLIGQHATLDCSACHAGNVYQGTPDDCYSCHQADYLAAKDPDHVALNISTRCEECHTPYGWEGASFDHAGITSGCYECHQADYDGTTDPDHRLAGFPTDCEVCHVTTTWLGATFDHDFPIFSGKHSGLSCSDCHTVPGSYTSFSCIDCHQHTQSQTDDQHSDVGGYVYESNACLECHPTGRSG